jgi:glycosyltransferase involved in cell wall biosynthesis
MPAAARFRIAMIGSRGVPCVYGGIERHVAEIGLRLADRGHEVTIFGRRPFCAPGEHEGMRVRVLPAISTKNLETASNTLAATIASIAGPYDIVHFHGIGPSLFSWMTARSRRATICTVHALDYRQSKWGRGARRLLKLGEHTALRNADAVVAVSRLMAADLASRYGATIREAPAFEEARRFGIEPGRYVLAVGRFIVERGFHTLLEAWASIETDYRLVIAGDAHFEERYARRLAASSGPRIIMPGYVSGRLLDELYAHCAFYVLPSTVEGLPISLIEAMAFARPTLVSDIPENLEVACDTAVTFVRGDAGDLARSLVRMLAMGLAERESRGASARGRVAAEYTWDHVTDELERLYGSMSRVRRRDRRLGGSAARSNSIDTRAIFC